MSILFVNPYGYIPGEGWNDEYRTFVLSQYLSEHCSKPVTWLLANVNHATKSIRPQSLFNSGNLTVRVVKSLGYKRNTSSRRLLFEIIYGIRCLAFICRSLRNLDLVVIAEPALTYGLPIALICKLYRVKVILDVWDLWPEHFMRSSSHSALLSVLKKSAFTPFFFFRSLLVRSSTHVIAVSDYYRSVYSYGAHYSQKSSVLPIGTNLKAFQTNRRVHSYNHSSISAARRANKILVVSCGTYGSAYGLQELLSGLISNESYAKNYFFVFAGAGPLSPFVEESCMRSPDLLLNLGPIPKTSLPSLYSQCDVGLCHYADGSQVSLPTKYFDFLAAGLPTLSNLKGPFSSEILQKGTGLSYEGSALSLIEALSYLFADRSRLDEIAKNVNLVSASFDHTHLLPSFLSILRSCCPEIW